MSIIFWLGVDSPCLVIIFFLFEGSLELFFEGGGGVRLLELATLAYNETICFF
jgi:hypothetical protein